MSIARISTMTLIITRIEQDYLGEIGMLNYIRFRDAIFD